MRVCDRKGCDERQQDTIHLSDGAEIDLCKKHLNDFMEYIKEPVKKRGRPKKEK